MASSGNPNQQQQQGFDMSKFFNPSNLPPPSQNPSNLGVPFAPPNPSASFPPPNGPFSYPPQANPNPNPYYNLSPQFSQEQQLPTLHHQRSVSFPTPPLQPLPSAPPQNPNAGARLMAMLSNPNPNPNFENSQLPTTPLPSISASSGEFSVPINQPLNVIHGSIAQPPPLRMQSSKLPRGRHLVGDRVVYDVDARLPGEEKPQLEVTPITKYISDPGLIIGHQIAVNKTYICYGLKLGSIRVLNINTALRSLLRGHSQRVTDMAFFAEDVPILASASIDGRIYIWKISEGPDEEEKPQISGNVVVAIQITGAEGSVHPRICWHCHKQEILVVAIGNSVLRIDSTKVGKGVDFVAEEPLQCPMDKLIDGIQLVGKHEGEVTDLSMCQWMTTRLVSASKDGTIKIWEDRKSAPLLVLRPHDGQPVDAAKFLVAPHRPDHIMLITAGPLNRELKLWSSSDEEGWLLPSDVESWKCTQILELKSSAEPRNEEAFFNQVVMLSEAGLILLANAKRNAIYAIHLEYGPNPASTCMDYLAEFTVTMPILSFIGTSDVLSHGEHLVQVYCVQTQAIQQYALDLSQCWPPPMENMGIEKSRSSVSRDAAESAPPLEQSGGQSFEGSFSTPEPNNHTSVLETSLQIKSTVSSVPNVAVTQEVTSSDMESNSTPMLSAHTDVSVVSPSLHLSPRLSRKLSDLNGDHVVTDYSVDRQMDSTQTNSSTLPSSNDASGPVMFKHPTHLITPAEIMATSSAESTRPIENSESETKIQDVIVNNDTKNIEVDVKVVGEAGFANNGESTHQIDRQTVTDRKERSFFSQASGLGTDVTQECHALPSETSIMNEARNSIMEALAQPSNTGGEEEDEANNGKAGEFAVSACVPQSAKSKKKKGKNAQASCSSPPSRSVSNFADFVQGSVAGSSFPSMENAFPQIIAMQEMMNQVLTTQKEMQKQMTMMVAEPVTKEGKRLEAALGRSMEKVGKANAEALWARIQEDNAKHEKLLRDRTQQIIGLINNFVNKDLVSVLERTIKKELAAVGANVARALSPAIEKTISSAITESFQRGVGDKAASQLEKSVASKLEATVARQIQVQFQTSGKQALQDGLKSSLETAVIPAFEMSCKAMFEQVDAAFQKGMVEHTAAAQHRIDSTHSQLALALRDSLNSASSVTQTLSGELAEGQRKLLALAAAGGNLNAGNPLMSQMSNGPLTALLDKVEQPYDPTKELSRLISERKYEEAFTAALQRSDVTIVSWLCSQVDLQRLLSTMPLPLSQGVLLSLLQQLACDITKDTSRKLAWMTDIATCIIPHDPMISVHVRPVLEQVYQILTHQRSLPTTTATELSSIRIVMHVINAMLMTSK